MVYITNRVCLNFCRVYILRIVHFRRFRVFKFVVARLSLLHRGVEMFANNWVTECFHNCHSQQHTWWSVSYGLLWLSCHSRASLLLYWWSALLSFYGACIVPFNFFWTTRPLREKQQIHGGHTTLGDHVRMSRHLLHQQEQSTWWQRSKETSHASIRLIKLSPC